MAETFRTGWTVGRLMLDTCIWVAISEPNRGVASEQPAIEELLELEGQRRVALAKADTVDVERTSGVEPSLAEERILETAATIEGVSRPVPTQPQSL